MLKRIVSLIIIMVFALCTTAFAADMQMDTASCIIAVQSVSDEQVISEHATDRIGTSPARIDILAEGYAYPYQSVPLRMTKTPFENSRMEIFIAAFSSQGNVAMADAELTVTKFGSIKPYLTIPITANGQSNRYVLAENCSGSYIIEIKTKGSQSYVKYQLLAYN